MRPVVFPACRYARNQPVLFSAFHSALAGEVPIIGAGGIQRRRRAGQIILQGGQPYQCYTGSIYRGPALVKECIELLSSPSFRT